MRQTDVEDAINLRKVIHFHYDGIPREVIPAAVGVTPKGNIVLRGYQIGGESSSGVLPEWRLFTLSKVSNGIVSESSFSDVPPDYNRGDRAMATIFAEL